MEPTKPHPARKAAFRSLPAAARGCRQCAVRLPRGQGGGLRCLGAIM